MRTGWGIKLQPAGGFNDMGGSREEVVATFRFLCKELGVRGVAFVEMEQYGAFLDPMGWGLKDLDPSREISPAFSGIIVGNTDYDLQSGAAAVREGRAQAIAFGRLFLANPDLPVRWREGLPLNETDWVHVYGGDGVPLEKGYTDYPLISSD